MKVQSAAVLGIIVLLKLLIGQSFSYVVVRLVFTDVQAPGYCLYFSAFFVIM